MWASLTIPPNASLVSGDNPSDLGHIVRGENRIASWTVNFSISGVFTFDVNISGYRQDTDVYIERVDDTSITVTVLGALLSPKNKAYSTVDIPLEFVVGDPVSWIGYSLDGTANLTVTENTTLLGLTEGPHNIIVYANDTAGKMESSSKIFFKVDTVNPSILGSTQTPNEDNVQPYDSVKVNVTLTDDLSGIRQATLNYTSGNGTWITTAMTNLEGDIWNSTIPPFPYGTNITYYVRAQDKAGNAVTSDDLGFTYEYHVIPEASSIMFMITLITTTLLPVLLLKIKSRKTANTRL
ncbi:MAG: hypothetical protein V3T10_05715 [Candidatus Bathyarchaeia archaeon]